MKEQHLTRIERKISEKEFKILTDIATDYIPMWAKEKINPFKCNEEIHLDNLGGYRLK
ncbi:Uncharacterised protein [uncultured archaeon]|nr:Uncharacterised protein [uncultured archaeon]